MNNGFIEVPDRPYHLSWDLTSVCDLHCSFCYDSAESGSCSTPAESKELIELILKQIIELEPLHLGIGGGEPTKSPYLSYILEFLYSQMREKMPAITIDSMQLFSHPKLILTARRINEALQENRVGFYLSIHGIGDVHDTIVGEKGHFVKQMRAVQFLKESGVPFAIGVVPTQQNLNQLDRLVELAEGLGSGLLNISQFVEIGRGENGHNLNLTPPQYQSLLEWISKTNARLGRRYVVTHEHWIAAYDYEMAKSDLFVGCSAGIYYLGVRSNGDIVPCQLNTHVLGNVRNETILDVWKNSPDLKRWRARDIDGPCRDCSLLFKCGGCRCNAVAADNGFLGSEPFCPVTKELRHNATLSLEKQDSSTSQDDHDTRSHFYVTEATILNPYVRPYTKQGDAICFRNDERDKFIKLSGCAKDIYLISVEAKELTVEQLENHFQNKYTKAQILEELEAMVKAGVITCAQ